jgi:hypothetical protein
MVLELRLGDVVQLRKLHACGGSEWAIVRLGADIGLRCRTCGHRVLLERPVLERRIKRFVARGPETAESAPPHQSPDGR